MTRGRDSGASNARADRPDDGASRARGRLTPRATALYVVRWIRADGRDVKHRYFAREHDARGCASKLARHGRAPQIFRAPVGDWEALPPSSPGANP